jgi:hypothetical protein
MVPMRDFRKRLRLWWLRMFHRPSMLGPTWLKVVGAPGNVLDRVFPDRAVRYNLAGVPRNRHGRRVLNRMLGTRAWWWAECGEIHVQYSAPASEGVRLCPSSAPAAPDSLCGPTQ